MFRFSLVLLAMMFTATASAHDVHIVQPAPYAQPYAPQPYYYPPPRRHSILGFGMRGTFSGALVGLGASYFAAQGGGDAWRTVGLSVSVGALAGAGLGLTLGVLDHMDVSSAYYISRDLSWGTLFGAMIGAIGGGIAAIGGSDGEAVLLGAAAGSLGGFGLGLLTGILEGQYRTRHSPAYYGSRVRVTVAQIAPEPRTWGLRMHGQF